MEEPFWSSDQAKDIPASDLYVGAIRSTQGHSHPWTEEQRGTVSIGEWGLIEGFRLIQSDINELLEPRPQNPDKKKALTETERALKRKRRIRQKKARKQQGR